MADRTSAGIFGEIFKLLAENPSEENKALAKKILPKTREFDFNLYQMYVDGYLIKLGLAEMDGEEIKYIED